jgi:hypothetical protein
MSTEPDRPLGQEEYAERHRTLRRTIIGSGVLDIAIAIVLFAMGIPIGGVILLAFGIIGTPLVLRLIDRDAQKRGHDIY